MKFHHFTFSDRLKLEALYRAGVKVPFIASDLGFSVSSIYRELKRGSYEHLNSDYSTELRYSAELSDNKYRDNLKAKGPGLKIGSDIEYANFIEYMISKKKYSPAAVLGFIKSHDIVFNTSLSKTTIYRYINDDLFLHITNKDLPVKRNKSKKKYKTVRAARSPKGPSIEKRPSDVLNRDSFGHWEMDCVIGKRNNKKTLLVLTERLTRKELIYLMPEKKALNVVDIIDHIYDCMGSDKFRSVFKSITVDNGSEFMDYSGMVSGSRTKVYYCHPYCSSERGSNENQNKLIRRHFPKGMDFTHITKAQVQKVESWINNYPRKIFGWRSSEDMFQLYMQLIDLDVS